MIDLLVENGAKVDTPLSFGQTALQLAIVLNQSDDRAAATISLLRSGANPNVVDRAGNTPLHIALGKSRPSLTIVKALLHFDASITIANKKGETPLELGKRSPLKELAALFNEADVYAKVKTDDSVSVSYPKGEAIQAGERKTYTIFVPYEASEGGLYIRVKLGGNLAPAFRIRSPGLVWSHPDMAWYWVRIPGGEKELRLELVAPPTISRATHIGISASIVTQDGEPTHASHLQMIIPATPTGAANPKASN